LGAFYVKTAQHQPISTILYNICI